MCHRDRFLTVGLSLALAGLVVGTVESSQAQDRSADSPVYLRPPQTCPAELQTLSVRLLTDLPTYANRVAARQFNLAANPPAGPSTVLVASPPDLTPIDLTPDTDSLGEADTLRQVFFTTLERQYLREQVVVLHHYHWLFLAPTAEGWHLALLFSSLAPAPGPAARPATPPQESSDGIVGQAIRLWLRDCRAGTIFSVEAEADPLGTTGESAPLDTLP